MNVCKLQLTQHNPTNERKLMEIKCSNCPTPARKKYNEKDLCVRCYNSYIYLEEFRGKVHD
jgi:hypothetical protein